MEFVGKGGGAPKQNKLAFIFLKPILHNSSTMAGRITLLKVDIDIGIEINHPHSRIYVVSNYA